MRHLLSFMQHEVVLALGWTLIHSLWQGLLLALVTGIMLLATRRSEAQKRYELLTGLFLLFIAVTGMTFARELYLAYAHPHFRPLANIAAGRSVISSIIPFAESHIVVNRSWASRLKEYFNEHAYLIVTIWFIIFIARFIKLIGEVAYIQRLKTYRTSEPPQAWKNRLKELMDKMSINTYVQLLESGIVKVPVVMGILKPVILLPLGLLSQLPPDEIEAILLHELAHIRRRDYFVNLVQSFAETLFFFNPALMWLSSLIREERENCCDDIAISVTNNKTTFIDALISFQEFDLAKPSFTMGFPGRKHQLLNRVKRIISKRNKTLNTTEKSILTLSMAILIMFSFVAAKNIPVSKIRKKLSFNSASPITPPINNLKEKNPETLRLGGKAETVSSFLLTATYVPVMHESIDTTPVLKEIQPTTQQAATDTDTSTFKSYSTSVSNTGKTKVVIITAVNRQGTEYRVTTINDRFVELAVNDVIIDDAMARYRNVIDAVEKPYKEKRGQIELNEERNRLMHESDMNRQKIAEFNKKLSPKRILVNGYWVIANEDTLIRQDYLNKQQELDSKLAELNKKSDVKDLEIKTKKLNSLRADMKELNIKMSHLDTSIATLKNARFTTLKLDTLKFKFRQQEYQPDKFNTASKLSTKSKLDLKNKSEAEALRRKTEELKRELLRTEEKLSRLQKDESIKNRQKKDLLNFKQQSVNIRNMIAALPDHFYVSTPNTAFNELFYNGVELTEQPNVELRRSKDASFLIFRVPGEYTLQFTDKREGSDNMVYVKKVRAQNFPAPLAMLSGMKRGDVANKKDLLASGKMVIYFNSPDQQLQSQGRIATFRATRISGSNKDESYQNFSDVFQGGMYDLINKSQKGDIIVFNNILVSLTDGTTRTTDPLTYKITDR